MLRAHLFSPFCQFSYQQKKIPVRDVDEYDAFAEIKMLGPQPPGKVGKKSLVLDLDETLVRS